MIVTDFGRVLYWALKVVQTKLRPLYHVMQWYQGTHSLLMLGSPLYPVLLDLSDCPAHHRSQVCIPRLCDQPRIPEAHNCPLTHSRKLGQGMSKVNDQYKGPLILPHLFQLLPGPHTAGSSSHCQDYGRAVPYAEFWAMANMGCFPRLWVSRKTSTKTVCFHRN